MRLLSLLFVVFFRLPVVCSAEKSPYDRLPKLPASYRSRPQSDWLIDPTPFKAGVFRGDRPDRIVLSNGLVSRVFKLKPNAATIELENLAAGQAVLRGVKPEAVVRLNGIRFPVGGLKGQPNYAYLLPQWIETLKADPRAFRFAGFETGKPKERFPWKRVRHHAPDCAWPPHGVYLRMDYKPPPIAVSELQAAPRPSSWNRSLFFESRPPAARTPWRLFLSEKCLQSHFRPYTPPLKEKEYCTFVAPANCSAFLECPIPQHTCLVEADFHARSDQGASWGPGLALVLRNCTLCFKLRPAESRSGKEIRFESFDGRRVRIHAWESVNFDLKQRWCLRIRLEGERVFFEAKPQFGRWRTQFSSTLPPEAGRPRFLRVGKFDSRGGSGDFGGDQGPIGEFRIYRTAAYGELTEEGRKALIKEKEALGRQEISVHYELYDGIPLYSKWITVHNRSEAALRLNSFKSEILAAVEYSSHVEDRGIPFPRPNIHVETDYSFGGMTPFNTSKFSVHWVPDPQYKTQVNYRRKNPCLLEVRPTLGPDVVLKPQETFESFRAFVLLWDSTDRERKSLSLRRMYRTIAPWVTENPLMLHVRWSDWKTVKNAIDQCADVGFEMVILSFGSGFNAERTDKAYLKQMQDYARYARSKGVEIGGYSLLASRRISAADDVVMPPGKRPTFGASPCLCSRWGLAYFRKLRSFFEQTGFTLLEHDGSYPGDPCASAVHPGHRGFTDSRWAQWRVITDFYKWCRARGIYLNVPDFYYLSGSNKCGMGYRETNWSLPREQQVIHTRQNIYDGTWVKTPSMGWMFVPLTQYHGGGAAATIEPLSEHLDHYERMLYSNLAFGVQACWRGPRLYDSPATRELVKRWVDWFKRYRDILESDIVHGRRADGRSLDWVLHVNPRLRRKGMLVVFNPLKRTVTKTLHVNLYYTGLKNTALIHTGEGRQERCTLDRDYCIELPVTVQSRNMNWFVIEKADQEESE